MLRIVFALLVLGSVAARAAPSDYDCAMTKATHLSKDSGGRLYGAPVYG